MTPVVEEHHELGNAQECQHQPGPLHIWCYARAVPGRLLPL